MELRQPIADDLHVHLRNDDRSETAIRATRHGGAGRVLVMPNTAPAITNGEEALAYKQWLIERGADFPMLMTTKLMGSTTPEDVISAAQAGCAAVKQYPMGVTTNSDDGVMDPRAMYPVYEAMQANDLVLSLHGEVPGVFVLDAEAAFISALKDIHKAFPKLRIVMEHITTAAAVEAVTSMGPNVVATITDHHLDITLQDVVGTRIQPHHFCMPVAKRPEDKAALIGAVRSGNPKFFSGTDTAPHKVEDKENACGCAGIFNAPYHMQFLATLFEELDMLDRLENFTSLYGAEFYRLARNKEELHLIKQPCTVPERFGPMVPFKAGKELAWSIA